jgi:hypothetical protein
MNNSLYSLSTNDMIKHYFSDDNFQKVKSMLPSYINMTDGDLRRVMQRILDDSLEYIDVMNGKTIDYIINDFDLHQREYRAYQNKKNYYAKGQSIQSHRPSQIKHSPRLRDDPLTFIHI